MNTEWLDRHGMLPKGTRVLCALSGGKDSVYLLYQLMTLAQARELTVGAAHFNHQLRGEESDRDEVFVRCLCERENIPLYVDGADVEQYAMSYGLGIEEAARRLRYDFLENVRREQGYDVIATAHQANDQAETMLLNLARGAGTKGLRGIPPVRGNIIRPILDVPRAEIDAYMVEKAIPFVEDSTNGEDLYRRNKLRHQVIPVLEEINPRFVSHAADAAMLLGEDDAYLQSVADSFVEEHYEQDSIPTEKLLELPRPVAARVLRRLCGEGLSRYHLEQVLALCRRNDGPCRLDITGQTLLHEQGRLYFHGEEPETLPEILLTRERGAVLVKGLKISWEYREYSDEIHNSLNTFCLKYENIKGAVLVGSRREGDKIRLAGRNCTKSIKALFQERKIPSYRRGLIPVIRDAAGVVGVYGAGIAERCVPKIGDEVLYIHCTEYKEIGGIEK